MLNVLLLGNGAREHAIAEALYKSPLLKRLYAVPGNPGIAHFAECHAMSVLDIEALKRFCTESSIDLVVVGPEEPSVRGVSDGLRTKSLVFAPSQAAARLEGSKVWAKGFMQRHRIPTAHAHVVETLDEAKAAVRYFGGRAFLKANGLCGGKGAFPACSEDELEEALIALFIRKSFGAETLPVLVEEALTGIETSVFYICAGTECLRLPTARDYKRRDRGDQGPNTGGMGSFSPSNVMTKEIEDNIERMIVRPTLNGMMQEGRSFTGILYVGIMLTEEGPKVIEYNVRMGDPEAQVVIPRIKDDLLSIMYDAAQGKIVVPWLTIDPDSHVCVNVTGPDYPKKDGRAGGLITGMKRALETGARVYHAGVQAENGHLLAGAGRVISVCASADNIADARYAAFQGVSCISYEHGERYRIDIAEGV